jgi:hypothetical protein
LLVAFANRKDQHHAWALKLADRVTEPSLTCEAVLASYNEGLVRPALGEHVARLTELAQR